jgi:hypothetical protein
MFSCVEEPPHSKDTLTSGHLTSSTLRVYSSQSREQLCDILAALKGYSAW